MLDTGAAFDDYFAVQQEAVRQLRAGKSHEDPVAVLEQMAFFLFSAGRLEEAFPYSTKLSIPCMLSRAYQPLSVPYSFTAISASFTTGSA